MADFSEIGFMEAMHYIKSGEAERIYYLNSKNMLIPVKNETFRFDRLTEIEFYRWNFKIGGDE